MFLQAGQCLRVDLLIHYFYGFVQRECHQVLIFEDHFCLSLIFATNYKKKSQHNASDRTFSSKLAILDLYENECVYDI